jgi:colicin import membrane protein
MPWLIAVVALFVGIGMGAAGGSGGSTVELEAANEEIATLESDLTEAEGQSASLEDSLAEAEADLAAAGDAAAALDAREEELNEREGALDKRENRLDDREANLDSKPDAASPGTSSGAQDSEPDLTTGQENARRSAEDYLSFSAFSRSGLIDQLKFEGYSGQDATVAVDSLNVNWNEQAARSAEEYLAMSGFSRSGLIEQLMFEGYTRQQAEYGVDKAGL